MAPSTHIEVAPEQEINTGKKAEVKIEKPEAGRKTWPAKPFEGSFQSSMLEYNKIKGGSKLAHALVSLAVNSLVLIVPIFMGLYFTDSIDLKGFASTFLVAPPPPPPPPPAAAPAVKVAPPKKVFEQSGKLVAPTVIPKQIQMLKEEQISDMTGGVAGGVPGGVAGGSMGGVLGGVIGGNTIAVPIAPKVAGPKAPVRVGGRVKEPRLIVRVDPRYPPLAIQTHMQGAVIVDAVIDEHGNVVEARVVSGPPLLIQAAMDAVRQWKYEPTYLNDEPVPVQLNVTVQFRLAN
jgi:periplasmic protein TonB